MSRIIQTLQDAKQDLVTNPPRMRDAGFKIQEAVRLLDRTGNSTCRIYSGILEGYIYDLLHERMHDHTMVITSIDTQIVNLQNIIPDDGMHAPSPPGPLPTKDDPTPDIAPPALTDEIGIRLGRHDAPSIQLDMPTRTMRREDTNSVFDAETENVDVPRTRFPSAWRFVTSMRSWLSFIRTPQKRVSVWWTSKLNPAPVSDSENEEYWFLDVIDRREALLRRTWAEFVATAMEPFERTRMQFSKHEKLMFGSVAFATTIGVVLVGITLFPKQESVMMAAGTQAVNPDTSPLVEIAPAENGDMVVTAEQPMSPADNNTYSHEEYDFGQFLFLGPLIEEATDTPSVVALPEPEPNPEPILVPVPGPEPKPAAYVEPNESVPCTGKWVSYKNGSLSVPLKDRPGGGATLYLVEGSFHPNKDGKCVFASGEKMGLILDRACLYGKGTDCPPVEKI